MGKSFFFFLIIMPIFGYSQLYKESELMENNVKEVHITAREFESGVLVKEVKSKDIVNQYGSSTRFITYDTKGEIKTNIVTHYLDHGKTSIDTTFRDNGEIKYLKIISKDIEKRLISHFQIIPVNDTVVAQTWFRNIKNQDSILVSNVKSKPYLHKVWEYDDKSELIKTTSYSPDGNVSSIDEVKYRRDGQCQIYFDDKGNKLRRFCSKNGEQVTGYFYNKTTYLYGIKLKITNKGKRVVKRNKRNLISNIQYIDQNGNILAEIEYKYIN